MRRTNLIVFPASFVLLGLIAGCESSNSESHAQASPQVEASSPVVMNVRQQIARGATVFTNNCAKCHGDAGQGTKRGPMLVGKGSFKDFDTAMDIAVFATKEMPPRKSLRAKMAESDYWAVLAFALSANGAQLTEPVGPNNASDITLH